MMGEIALYSFIVLLLTGTFLTFFFDAADGRGALQRQLPTAAGRRDVAGLRLDAAHLLRRPRRPCHPPDPPLGRADVRRGHADPHVPDFLHRSVPQAARAQLDHRHFAHRPRRDRGLCRLLAPRRPALRHGPADRGRDHVVDTRHRILGVVRRVRRGVPGHGDRGPALHCACPADPGHPARPDHGASGPDCPPEAHPVPRTRTDRILGQRGTGLPDLRRQGGRLLLHRLRRTRRARRVRADQPHLAVRPVQPGAGDLRLAAGLVHGHAGRLDPPVPVVGDPRPVRPIYRAGTLLAYRRAAHDLDRPGRGVSVHRGPADEGPRDTPPAAAAA